MEQKASALSNIMQETLIKQLIADYFDEVVLIETATGRVLNISDSITCQKHTYRRYDGKTYNEQMLAIVREDLPPAEREALQKAISLNTVINELKTKERYSVELVLPGQGSRAVCKNLVYKFLDQSGEIIVLVCQDVSEIELNGTDPLTGLYNSAGFHHKVESWIKANPGKRFRIQRYNIDRFRDINGIYGYEVGNKLLRDFGGYMKRYNSANSFAAHLNADHFVRFCAEDDLTVSDCYNNFSACFKNYALLVLTACIAAPVTASAEDRLTLTQDFESYAGGTYDVTNAEVAETPDDANNKALHFKSDCVSPGNAWARVFGNGNSEKPLKEGSTYSLTYRVYLVSHGKDANDNDKRAIINAQYSDNNVGQWANGRTTINQYFTDKAKVGEWVTTTVNFTATKDAYLVFYVANDGGTGYSVYSDFYIDDVVLKELTETTVTFNSNDGSDCAAITAFSGAALTLPTPTKEGCDFLGWYEDAALTKGFVSTVQPESDITLYAKWDVIGDGVWEQDFESYVLTSSNNKRLQSETVYAGNYALQRFEVKNAAGVLQPNSFVPLFPRSTEKIQVGKKYTLTFKYKSASSNPFNLYLVSSRTAETNQGTAALSFSAAAAANWTEITKTIDLTDSSKFTTDNYLCLYSWGTAEYFLDDIRLVESAPVTITYVTNNSTTVESMTDYPGAALTLPTPNSDTLGQVFGGWYTDEALTNKFTATVYPAASTTLYAKWTKPGWTQDFETFKDEYNTNYSNVITSGISDHDLITVADREADYVTSGKRSIRYSYDSEVDGGTASGDNRILINAVGDRNALCDYLTKAGDVLKVSFKYKVTAGAPKLTVQTGYDDLTNVWAANDKSGIAWNESSLDGTAGEWQTFTKSFTVNPADSISRVKTLVFILRGAGEVYIDDVEALVVPTGVETAYNNVAAIRAADADANVKQGFRLYNKVNKQWLEDYNIVEFGALAIRKGRLAEGAALNASTENAAKGVAWVKDGEYKLWEDLGDSYTFTAVLIGIREKFYAENYSVVTYAKDKDGNYIYGEVQDLCVYDVVDSILSSTASEQDKTTANAVIEQAVAAKAEDSSVVTYEEWKNNNQTTTA